MANLFKRLKSNTKKSPKSNAKKKSKLNAKKSLKPNSKEHSKLNIKKILKLIAKALFKLCTKIIPNLFKRFKNFIKNRKKSQENIKQKRLANKIITKIMILLFVVMLVLCVALSVILKKSYTEVQEQKIIQLATINSKIVNGHLETIKTFGQTLSNEVSNYKNMDSNTKNELMKKALNSVLDNNDIFSAYFAFDPDLYFENTPQGISYYVYRDGDSRKLDIKNDYLTYISQEYYSVVKMTKECHITEPYEHKLSNGKKVYLITLSTPILNDKGEFLGVANCDILTDLFVNFDYDMGGYKTANNYIVTQGGVYLVDSTDNNNVGKQFKIVNEGDVERANAIKKFKKTKINGINPKTEEKAIYYNMPIKVEGFDKVWSNQISVDESEAFRSVRIIVLTVALISLGGLTILAVFIYKNLRKSLKPISGIVSKIEQMGTGNLTIEKATSYSNDELGKLTRINENTADTLNSYITEISDVLTQISNGNLDVEVTREYIGDFNEIKVSLNNISSSLNSVFLEMNVSAEQVFEGAAQVSNGAQSLSQGAMQQASAIDELSTTIKEMNSQIKENAINANKAREMAMEGGRATVESQEQMKRMISAMDEISKKSNEIGKIIKNIHDIAFQTNILALNASVEAARAGSAGKGFAVVAQEVRNLAGKSAESAKSTEALIDSSVKAIKNGSKIVSETAASLESVVQGTSQATNAIKLIAELSDEQAKSAEQVSVGVSQISEVVQTNSATAEESAAASEELSTQSKMLKEFIGRFKLKENHSEDCISTDEFDEEFESLNENSDNKFDESLPLEDNDEVEENQISSNNDSDDSNFSKTEYIEL